MDPPAFAGDATYQPVDLWPKLAQPWSFYFPVAVAIDGKGNLYVAATNTIYKETLTAGSYLQSAIITGVAESSGIALDGSGNFYITSAASGDVHKETLEPNGGYSETGIGYGITHPGGLAVDGFVLCGMQAGGALGNHLRIPFECSDWAQNSANV